MGRLLKICTLFWMLAKQRQDSLLWACQQSSVHGTKGDAEDESDPESSGKQTRQSWCLDGDRWNAPSTFDRSPTP